jgi:hypothetical protein
MPRFFLLVLILLMIISLPNWPYSIGWGYYPSGGAALGAAIIAYLLLAQRL